MSAMDVPAVPVLASDDEPSLNLHELAVFARRRLWFVLLAGVLAGAAAATYAFLKAPEFEAKTILAPVSDDSSPLSVAGLGGQLGGLASLAGINLGGSEGKAERIALLRSRGLTEDFIKDKALLPVLFAKKWDAANRKWNVADRKVPTLQRAFKLFDEDIREVDEDRMTGLVTLTVTWTDRQAAAAWANELVARANATARDRAIEEARHTIEYLYKELEATPVLELRQGIYRLIEANINRITVAKARSEYAFRVVDRARPSDADQFVWPRRVLIIGGGLVLGSLMAIVAVVLTGVLGQALTAATNGARTQS